MHRLLRREHGPRPWSRQGSSLDVLVRAMLSQNTSWKNAREGYRRLKRDLPSWTAVERAPLEQVQSLIGVCGLGRQRAVRLQALLVKLRADFGRPTIEPLRKLPVKEAADYLHGLHGIGPRTVNVTLLFAFDAPIFPVDNGILRILKRSGLVPRLAGDDEARAMVETHVAGPKRHELHVLLYGHGSSVCGPRKPRCDHCCLQPICTTGRRKLPRGSTVPFRLARQPGDGLPTDTAAA